VSCMHAYDDPQELAQIQQVVRVQEHWCSEQPNQAVLQVTRIACGLYLIVTLHETDGNIIAVVDIGKQSVKLRLCHGVRDSQERQKIPRADPNVTPAHRALLPSRILPDPCLP
jgi:hypothetical protein